MQKGCFVIGVVLILTTVIWAQHDIETEEIQGHTMYTVLGPGDIPAIMDPQFVDSKAAEQYYHDDEPLMIVRSKNSVRAYSTWHLDRHEIVNDVIDGKPIAVTW